MRRHAQTCPVEQAVRALAWDAGLVDADDLREFLLTPCECKVVAGEPADIEALGSLLVLLGLVAAAVVLLWVVV